MKKETVILTGASSGLGWVLAERLAQAGMKVCAVARNIEKLNRLQKKHPQQIFPFSCDVSRSSDVQKVFADILQRFPKPGILINNASVFSSADFAAESWENIDRLIDTNLKGTLYTTRAVIPSMISVKKGWVINISSVSGTRGIPQQAIYGASKHGVNGFSEVIAQELLPHGVLVTQICPGGIKTPLWNKKNPYPGKTSQLIRPEEIADLILFLLQQPRRTLFKKLVFFPTNEWH